MNKFDLTTLAAFALGHQQVHQQVAGTAAAAANK